MNLAALFAVLCSSFLRLASADGPPMTEEHPAMDCFPTSCGGLKNISYPFWVDKQQPAHCGYPSFMLNCSDQIPTIQMSPGEFQVKKIFYENRSVWLSSITTLNLCLDRYWNLSFSLTPFTVSLVNKELVLLFGCSDPQPNYYKLPCGSHDGSVNGTLAYMTNQYLGSSGSCQVVNFPVLTDSGAVTSSDYLRLIDNGFLVNWTAAVLELSASKAVFFSSSSSSYGLHFTFVEASRRSSISSSSQSRLRHLLLVPVVRDNTSPFGSLLWSVLHRLWMSYGQENQVIKVPKSSPRGAAPSCA